MRQNSPYEVCLDNLWLPPVYLVEVPVCVMVDVLCGRHLAPLEDLFSSPYVSYGRKVPLGEVAYLPYESMSGLVICVR